MYSITTIRQKAYKIGYQVKKGFQHIGRSVFYDSTGERHVGYTVSDIYTGLCAGGISGDFDNLWSLDDVVDFLKDEYESCGMIW